MGAAKLDDGSFDTVKLKGSNTSAGGFSNLLKSFEFILFADSERLKLHLQAISLHWAQEQILLRQRLLLLAFAVFYQYLHSVATNIAYFVHTPRKPLYDLGFALVPALENQIWSEVLFFVLLFSTILFALSPLLRAGMCSSRSRTGTPVFMTFMLARFVSVLVLSQTLRIICFLSTSLPGPNYHCRPGAPEYAPPQTAWDVFGRMDAFKGCGDLVFSSHTTFALLCALTWTKYSRSRILKRAVWLMLCAFVVLCIGARKHYTLDIVVACYTVPLVWIAFDKYYPDVVPQELQLQLEKQFGSSRIEVDLDRV